MPAPMKQPHWRTRLHRVALLVNPANFFHAAAASQIAFEAIAQAHYGAVFVVADALLVSEAAHSKDSRCSIIFMPRYQSAAPAGGLIALSHDRRRHIARIHRQMNAGRSAVRARIGDSEC